MSNLCPKTGEVCATLVNLQTMKEHARGSEEFAAVGDLRSTVVGILGRGVCRGAYHEDGFTFCSSDRQPEIAEKLDEAEEKLGGYSGLFEIENIGKVRGDS